MMDDELAGIYSKKRAKTLSGIVQALGTEDHKARTIDASNFAVFVREMRELLRTGSRKYGDAITEASHYEDEGKARSASRVYRDFIAACPSDFYKAMAERGLKRLMSPKPPVPVASQTAKADIVRLNRLLSRIRDLLGRSATQLVDLKLNTRQNLQKICEADRQVCDILADIKKIAADDKNTQ